MIIHYLLVWAVLKPDLLGGGGGGGKRKAVLGFDCTNQFQHIRQLRSCATIDTPHYVGVKLNTLNRF